MDLTVVMPAFNEASILTTSVGDVGSKIRSVFPPPPIVLLIDMPARSDSCRVIVFV